jgi:hypothetical protein
MKRWMAAIAIGAAVFAGACAPSNAAELGLDAGPRARHVRTAPQYWDWRVRCAWSGHYCLYAEYGYVYHYPWDNRPIAYTYRRHRR